MALQIIETNGVFSVYGELNGKNVTILNHHMKRFIKPSSVVMLSLEKIKSIDSYATYMLQQMYRNAAKNSSILSIFGSNKTDILRVFKKTKTSYILSNDRI